MNFISKLFKREKAAATKPQVGDIVVKHRHYEFKGGNAILLDDPEPNFKGTKWRFTRIGQTEGKVTPPTGWQYSGPGG
jgi:hypothetical protein